MGSFYELAALDIDGKKDDFSRFKGQVSLVVNVACK
jgi:glutathione peroxidase-family protein